MANSLSQPRTVFHRRLQGTNDRLEAGFAALNSDLRELTKTLNSGFNGLAQAVKDRPPVDIQAILNAVILNVEIKYVMDSVSCTCIQVDSEQSMKDAIKSMYEEGVHCAFVQSGKKCLGIITSTQCLEAVSKDNLAYQVKDCMLKERNPIRLNDTVGTACERLEAGKVVVVIDDQGKPIRLLSSEKLLRWLANNLKGLASS